MPDIAPVLTDISNTRAWAGICGMTASGGAPGALLVIIPPDAAPVFRDMYARMVLCGSGAGTDGCQSCRAWTDDGHPDMIVAGDGSGPPGVAECIAMQSEMSLKPFSAPGRLAVVPFADALSLPAANSLLKIAEEPPEGGRLLFLAEEDNLIPTIRSRSWTVSFSLSEAYEASPPPDAPADWAKWIEKRSERLKKRDPRALDELCAEADAWSRWLADRGEWRVSAELRNALYISKKRHMPVSMVQDAILAILREGVPIGQIFGDLR